MKRLMAHLQLLKLNVSFWLRLVPELNYHLEQNSVAQTNYSVFLHIRMAVRKLLPIQVVV